MITLRMSEEEASVLKEVLTSYLSDLRMEIADTDLMDFRERLKRQEEILKSLIQELPSGVSEPSTDSMASV